VVGRGALLDPSCHSGDLSNLAVWSRMNGVCVKGHHLVRHVDDHLLLQEYFVTLGFTYKHIAEDGKAIQPKRLGAIRNGVNTLLFLTTKYAMPASFSASLQELNIKLNEQERSGSVNKIQFMTLEEQCTELFTVMHQTIIHTVQANIIQALAENSLLFAKAATMLPPPVHSSTAPATI
jgi:hypothetical protein